MNILDLSKTAGKKYRLTLVEMEQLVRAMASLATHLDDKSFVADRPGFANDTQAQWNFIYHFLIIHLESVAVTARGDGFSEHYDALVGKSAAMKIRRIRRDEVSRDTLPLGMGKEPANDR